MLLKYEKDAPASSSLAMASLIMIPATPYTANVSRISAKARGGMKADVISLLDGSNGVATLNNDHIPGILKSTYMQT